MMIGTQLSHYSQLVYQALFSILSVVTILLGERLYCVSSAVSDAFHLVDRGEVAFPEFSEGFEHLMEAFLVEFF